MLVNTELYRVFYTVAKCGSLTRAARELFISQPAVSQAVKLLEKQIGGTLFIRTAKGMDLTYEGGIIFEYIEKAQELIDTAEHKFKQLKDLEFGSFTIGANDTLCKNYLLKYICAFNKLYPDVIIRIKNRTTVDTINLLRSGKADIGFVNLPADAKDMDVAECFKIHDIFVADKKTFESVKEPPEYQGLKEMPLIVIERTSTTRMLLDEYFESQKITLTPSFELSSHELVVEFAKAGLGIGCVVKEFVEEDIKEGRLFEIPLKIPLPGRGIGLITPSGAPIKFAAKRFVEMIGGKQKK
ncbi:MAG: LysR family transcriptional regulator [Clostridiales bacterium]|jgi:DNA-binding transcriptional LysR family regulator|nr:LysR family transcriptional regulator [Clostridiales bacterium]